MEITPDDAMSLRIIKALFRGIQIKSFVQTIYYYVIDSKYRDSKRLDKFLADQLINPDPRLVNLAKSLRKSNIDDTMLNILKWVRVNIRYVDDKSNYGKEEFWADAIITYEKLRDDCDGKNALIWVLGRLNGVSSDVLYSVIGETTISGHYWVNYWSTKYDRLIVLDSTYNYNPYPFK